ncbi:acyl-CoA-binding domain-containing protein 4 [Mortierella sp. GBA30]|nr:acyl-CoA-binding domain-containing protein 4 [Mortierella sp. GBA30]
MRRTRPLAPLVNILIKTCISSILLLSIPRKYSFSCHAAASVAINAIRPTPSQGSSTDPSTSPQPTPLAAVGAASCYSQGTWFIQGGYTGAEMSTQAHTLDLTRPWDTRQPPWTPLPNSPLATQANACIVSFNHTYSFVNHSGPVLALIGSEDSKQPFMSLLDISTGTWTAIATKVKVPSRTIGVLPVGNPKDGKVYMRGGYQSVTVDTMDVYDPKTDTLKSIPIPNSPILGGDLSTGEQGVPRALWYSAAWCEKRQSILYYGGSLVVSLASAGIFEYIPATNTWGFIKTTGAAPSAREDHCMAINQEGTRLVIFGGQDSDVLGDIYVLDLNTMTWTSGPLEEKRMAMNCVIHDDGFLAWGGCKDSLFTPPYREQPIVFNLTTMTWTAGYKMSVAPVPTSSNGSSRSPTFALALGLGMGIVAIGAISVGICLYRREKRKAVKNYGRINAEASTRSTAKSSTATDNVTPETLLQDPMIPRPVHRRDHGNSIRHMPRNQRHSFSDNGSNLEGDDISLKTETSGKYDEEEEERFRQGSFVHQPSVKKGRKRTRRAPSIGHKIELTRMDQPRVSLDGKEEDPTFRVPSNVRPTAAPGLPLESVPRTEHSSLGTSSAIRT